MAAETRATNPPRSTLESAWPLFGLRLRSARLELRLPTDDDLLELLDVAKSGIHPPGEMPFGAAWSLEAAARSSAATARRAAAESAAATAT